MQKLHIGAPSFHTACRGLDAARSAGVSRVPVPVAFGSAYVGGELVKQRFLAVSGYTENGQTPAEMRRLSGILGGMNLALVGLALLS